MQEYETKRALIAEIEKTADLFIKEFTDVEEGDTDKLIDGVDRTPAQLLAYQLGWLDLIMKWDKDEAEGKEVVTPCEGYKWNNLVVCTRVFMTNLRPIPWLNCRIYLKKKSALSSSGWTGLRRKMFSRRAAANGRLQHRPTGRFGNGCT